MAKYRIDLLVEDNDDEYTTPDQVTNAIVDVITNELWLDVDVINIGEVKDTQESEDKDNG